jgi:hypothetical protein
MQYLLTQEEHDEHMELIRLGKMLKRERADWDVERDRLHGRNLMQGRARTSVSVSSITMSVTS